MKITKPGAEKSGRIPKEKKAALEGSRAFLLRQAELLANELRMDPFEIISRFAIGDVVGLGMMTPEELAFPGLQDRKTKKWIKVPGKVRAWDLIGMSMRFDAAKELLPYLYAKKQNVTITEASKSTDPSKREKRVVISLPHNGRESTAP